MGPAEEGNWKDYPCSYEVGGVRCGEPFFSLASGKDKKVAGYCKQHAELVADDSCPEYIVTCPNCGCQFGVI